MAHVTWNVFLHRCKRLSSELVTATCMGSFTGRFAQEDAPLICTGMSCLAQKGGRGERCQVDEIHAHGRKYWDTSNYRVLQFEDLSSKVIRGCNIYCL